MKRYLRADGEPELLNLHLSRSGWNRTRAPARPAAVHGDIADRPTWPKVKSGARDCEVATVLGAGHEGVIASAGHRMSEVVVLRALANETKAMVRDTLVSMLGSVGELVPMVTADNDKAFPGCLEFGKAPDTDIYFCFADPCDSCGRVLNERPNGPVHQYLGPRSESERHRAQASATVADPPD